MKYKKILYFWFLFFGVLFSLKVSAITEAERQNLILQLQNQINLIMQQISALQSQPAVTCHQFNVNLGYLNSGNSEVGYLHSILNNEGISFLPDSGNVYGTSTMNAVKLLQKKYGINQTGYVGPATRAALNNAYKCSVQVTVSVPPIPFTPSQPKGPLSITLNYPKGGETWPINSTQKIDFSLLNIGSYDLCADIMLVDSLGNKAALKTNVPAFLSNSVDVQFGSGYALKIRPDFYKIQVDARVCQNSGGLPLTTISSDYFSASCPASYPWDNDKSSCLGTPTCPSPTIWNGDYLLCAVDLSCPSGMTWNKTSFVCIKNPNCISGFSFNETSNLCLATPKCPQYYSWDTTLAICTQDYPCTQGGTYDSALNKCTSRNAWCPSGYVSVISTGSSGCVDQASCSTGTELINNRCQAKGFCPTGTILDNLLRMCTAPAICPSGMVLDKITNKCYSSI